MQLEFCWETVGTIINQPQFGISMKHPGVPDQSFVWICILLFQMAQKKLFRSGTDWKTS